MFDPVPQQFMVPNLPHRPPFVPQVPCPAALAPYLERICGNLMWEIQRTANMNPLRQAVYWTYGVNAFQNQNFPQLFAATVDMFCTLVYRYNLPPDQALGDTVGMMVSMQAARQIEVHPGLRSMLSPDALTEATNLIQRFYGMGAEIQMTMQQVYAQEQMQQQQMQMQNRAVPQLAHTHGPGGGYNMAGHGMVAHSMANHVNLRGGGGGYPVGHGHVAVGTGKYGMPGQVTPVSGPTVSLQHDGKNRAGGTFKPRSSGRDPVVYDQQSQEPVFQQQQPAAQPARVVEQPIREIAPPAAVQERPAPTVIKEITMSPAQPNAVSANVETLYGVEAAADGYKVSFNANAPCNQAYDPETTMSLYDIDSSGVRVRVTERIVARDPNVNFEDHNLEFLFKPKTLEDRDRNRDYELAAKAFKNVVLARDLEELLRERKNLQDHVEMAEGDEVKFIGESVRLPTTLVGLIGEDPRVRLDYDFPTDGDLEVDRDEGVVSFRMRQFHTWSINGTVAIKALELQSTRNWLVLRQRMTAFREALGVDRYWHLIHDQLTHAVRDLLAIEFGTTLDLDSFVDDIIDIDEMVQSKYGEVVYEAWNRSCGDVTAAALRAVTGAEFREYFTEYDDSNDVVRAAFVIDIDVTLLPIRGTDINLQYHGAAGRVMESSHPELHAAIKKRFENALVTDRHVTFVTVDNEVMYCYKSRFGRDTFLISRSTKK